jgi:hypothetical protein
MLPTGCAVAELRDRAAPLAGATARPGIANPVAAVWAVALEQVADAAAGARVTAASEPLPAMAHRHVRPQRHHGPQQLAPRWAMADASGGPPSGSRPAGDSEHDQGLCSGDPAAAADRIDDLLQVAEVAHAQTYEGVGVAGDRE